MSDTTDRADDLAAARGCQYGNECWTDCTSAAQAALDAGLDDADRALLAEYDRRQAKP